MPQSLSKMNVHIIFSTKNRDAMLTQEIQPDLYRYIGGICNNLECPPVQIGGFTDHLHILCVFSRKIALMNLVKEIKVGSSVWIKNLGSRYSNFHWQDGYGCFSVSPNETGPVINYIQQQTTHHQKRTYQEEYRDFLKTYDVTYDERYVWD
jgi:REP element-mobilizing transposase RayT